MKHNASKYNYYLFPFIFVCTLIFSFYQCFSYVGFLDEQIFLWFELSILFYITSGLFVNYHLESSKKGISGIYKFLVYADVLIMIGVLFVSLCLVFLDLNNYPGYVYNKIHFQPKNLYWVLFVLIFYLVQRNLKKIPQVSFKKVIIYSLFIWVLVFNIRFISSEILKNVFYIVKHPLASYDDKMKAAWGDFYNYVLFIRNNTPPDSIIATPPPIFPWNNEGSGPLFTAFLFPRKFSQGENDSNFVDFNADYALIAWGSYRCTKNIKGPDEEACHGWPRVNVSAEWIIYRKENSSEIINSFENTLYDPKDSINKYAWGLIKIKH